MNPIRRIVTGHDDAGKAVVLSDGPARNVKVRKATGNVSMLLWVTDETPADISANADRADREIGTAPPANGSILRTVDFPPVTPEVAAISHADVMREMDLGRHVPEGARHPFMHRTRSVDYAIVLKGEIDMLLDDSEVHLKAGDILVQQGTNHAWVNNGKETCRIAFILIDAQEPPAWRKSR
jgi:mannose-6-phosphate isomerase-like protein (cupin superfamily)